MSICMKTTVEISDALLSRARQVAAREDTTLRRLIEEGLRRVLGDRRRSGPFQLRQASFTGDGLRSEADGGGWERIRDAAYEGRGA